MRCLMPMMGTVNKHIDVIVDPFALPQIQGPRPLRKRRRQQKQQVTVEDVACSEPPIPQQGPPVCEGQPHPQDVLGALTDALVSTAERVLGRAQRRPHYVQDEVVNDLSMQQKRIRLQINDMRDPIKRRELMRQRMLLMRAMHKRLRDCASRRIDQQVEEIEKADIQAQMFKAARQVRIWNMPRLILHDNKGHEIKSDMEKAQTIAAHFAKIFMAKPDAVPLTPFIGLPRPLNVPICTEEVNEAIDKLRRHRAAGPDQLPAELLKAAKRWCAPTLAMTFNSTFERHLPIQVGRGIIIPLPKPGKPPGPCKSLRPVTLLSSVRKVLSLIVVRRAKPRFEARLPPSQAGAREGRSTADGVWVKRMLIATVMHFKIDIYSLGTDISQAFDSVDRGLLLEFFEAEGWMVEDELRMTRLLLADTTLQVRVGCALSDSITSAVGALQGDALSMLIFIGYLAGAVRNVKKVMTEPPPSLDLMLKFPADTSYVDDVDHHSTSAERLEKTLVSTETIFAKWKFQINRDKTERLHFFVGGSKQRCVRCSKACPINATSCDICASWWHNSCAGITQAQFQQFVLNPDEEWVCQLCVTGQAPTLRGEEPWRKARHLGTLLDTASDVAKRIQCATAAFATLNRVWPRRTLVSEMKRVHLFKAFVLPHFTYNLCTQALTRPLENRIDVAHRKLLRKLIGVVYPNIISNVTLYNRTQSEPISVGARLARWAYFGHVLRRKDECHPAAEATFAFFRAKEILLVRPNHPRDNLIDVLRADLKATEAVHGLELNCEPCSCEPCPHVLHLQPETSPGQSRVWL